MRVPSGAVTLLRWASALAALGIAACSLVGSSLDHFTAGGGPGPEECAAGYELCGGVCVDVGSDPANCGKCAAACPSGQVCDSASCSDTCSQGKTNCDGACVDLDNDVSHCGDCAVACNPGELCGGGNCTMSCFPGQTPCGSSCIDTQSDDLNCGACDVACPPGQKCTAGTCEVSCTTDQTKCGGVCVSTQSNVLHCGGCDQACNAGETCTAGQCEVACPGTQTACNGLCYDLLQNHQNCGACGNACLPAELCGNGQCSLNCPSGQTECNGVCADLQTSSANCGACGTTCTATQECSAGTCVTACKTLLNQPITDPWGFSWDGLERATKPYAEAKTTCDGIAGRLPTASELFRVSATQSATVGQSSHIDYLWSIVPYGPTSQVRVRLSDGGTSTLATTSSLKYRCVCPPALPTAYVGNNCNGPSGQGCYALDAENKKLVIDVADRPPVPKGSAIWECGFYRGHLATPGRLVEAIQQGVGAGSNVYLHTGDEVRNDSDLVLRWQAAAGFDVAAAISQGATSGSRPFRCVGANVDVGAGMVGESSDSAAATWPDAATGCWTKGAHLPTPTEHAELVGKGLAAGSGVWLWGADQSSVTLTTATIEVLRWTGTTVPSYVNPTDIGSVTKTTSQASRCITYPVDASYAGPADTQCSGGCTALTLPGTSGAKLWFDGADRSPAVTLTAAIDACRQAGGHVPSERDYLEAIRAGLAGGTNAWLWTTDFQLVSTSTTSTRRAALVRWTATAPAYSDAWGVGASASDPALTRAFRCMWTNELR